MPRYITVSSLLLFILIGCQAEEPSSLPPEEQLPPFSDLLLPEHRDTTTVFNVGHDSLYTKLNYNTTATYFHKTYTAISFAHLNNVTFRVDTSIEGFLYSKPYFSQEVQSLEGKEVMISGFLIPISHTEHFYALSANPYTACFFCGGAGPESVIDLRLAPESDLKGFNQDDRITVFGTLRLNDDSFYELCYILESTVVKKASAPPQFHPK